MSKKLAIEGDHTSKKGDNSHSYVSLLKQGIVAGIGWAFGVTIGFVLVSTILVVVLQQLGGLPFIGDFIADVVENTQEQLLKRTVVSPIENSINDM